MSLPDLLCLYLLIKTFVRTGKEQRASTLIFKKQQDLLQVNTTLAEYGPVYVTTLYTNVRARKTSGTHWPLNERDIYEITPVQLAFIYRKLTSV